MSLVNAKCTNCGANLTVDETKDAAICQYCGSAFIVEKAINNYNVVNNIKADVVNVYGATNDFDIRGGVLVKYTGSSINPVIPDGVVKIGAGAFANTLIESVTIPDSVTEIEDAMEHYNEGKYQLNGAFELCSKLKKVNNGKNIIKIGKKAFSKCLSLDNFSISNKVNEIGEMAFWNCRKSCLEKIPNYFLEKKYMREWVSYNYDSVWFEVDFFNYVFENRVTDEKVHEYQKLKKEQEKESYRKMGRCQHCGGGFEGFFTKKCIVCGKPKDY